jgi:UDP:flavonoid glycosyltransferase YjiC (YdhE family)
VVCGALGDTNRLIALRKKTLGVKIAAMHYSRKRYSKSAGAVSR